MAGLLAPQPCKGGLKTLCDALPTDIFFDKRREVLGLLFFVRVALFLLAHLIAQDVEPLAVIRRAWRS